MTLSDAPGLLAHYVRNSGAAPLPARRDRVVTVDEGSLLRARDGFNALAESLNSLHKVITDHNRGGGPQLPVPTVPKDAIQALRGFVKQVLDAGYLPDPAPAPARPTGPER
jgi:hypothetical protein